MATPSITDLVIAKSIDPIFGNTVYTFTLNPVDVGAFYVSLAKTAITVPANATWQIHYDGVLYSFINYTVLGFVTADGSHNSGTINIVANPFSTAAQPINGSWYNGTAANVANPAPWQVFPHLNDSVQVSWQPVGATGWSATKLITL